MSSIINDHDVLNIDSLLPSEVPNMELPEGDQVNEALPSVENILEEIILQEQSVSQVAPLEELEVPEENVRNHNSDQGFLQIVEQTHESLLANT